MVESVVGKDPKLKGKAPWASDLYSDILKDTDKSIRLLSDIKLTDEGYIIWKKLLDKGHKITIYVINNPGQSIKSFRSTDEMDEFFKHDDTKFQDYQYVLSEDHNKMLYVSAHFNTRRARELTGLL